MEQRRQARRCFERAWGGILSMVVADHVYMTLDRDDLVPRGDHITLFNS